MVTQLLDELLSFALPPDKPVSSGTPADWQRVEQQIGTVLPDDYKHLVNTYGLGSFGGCVCLLNPFISSLGPGSLLNLQRGLTALQQIESFKRKSPDAFQPFPIYPASGGLLPWGKECHDSRMMCWRTLGNPNSWKTILLDNDWSEDYTECNSSLLGFLVGWLSGQVTVSLYPPQPLARPLFQKVLF